jgi:hypothetical protein
MILTCPAGNTGFSVYMFGNTDLKQMQTRLKIVVVLLRDIPVLNVTKRKKIDGQTQDRFVSTHSHGPPHLFSLLYELAPCC